MADPRTRDAIATDYQTARDRGDAAAMRRYQNEEARFVLLAILERLAADERSFVHGIALKGGILMAGELHSARSSADMDATTDAVSGSTLTRSSRICAGRDGPSGSDSRASPIGPSAE